MQLPIRTTTRSRLPVLFGSARDASSCSSACGRYELVASLLLCVVAAKRGDRPPTYTFTYICIYVNVYTYIYIFTHTYMYVYMYAFMYVCIQYIYIHIQYTYTDKYTYIYIHTHVYVGEWKLCRAYSKYTNRASKTRQKLEAELLNGMFKWSRSQLQLIQSKTQIWTVLHNSSRLFIPKTFIFFRADNLCEPRR